MKFEESDMKPGGRRDGYVLSTGKRFYAYGDRLSLDSTGRLAYGHDGYVEDDDIDGMEFTPEEKREIADHMIARWMRWAPPSQGIMVMGQPPPGSLPPLYPMPMLQEHLRIVQRESGVRVERITVEGDWIPASPTIQTKDEAQRMIAVSFRFKP